MKNAFEHLSFTELISRYQFADLEAFTVALSLKKQKSKVKMGNFLENAGYGMSVTHSLLRVSATNVGYWAGASLCK